MKRIMDFFIGQIFIIIVMLCAFLYILYSFSNNTQNPSIYYEEVIIDNYQIIVDLNTGMIDKNEILKIDFCDLNTNQTILKINSICKLALILSVISTIVIDIIYLIFTIFNAIILFIITFKYRKLLKDKCDMSDERLYELPQYEPIIANAIYKKRYQYLMVQSRFEYYYRKEGVLDRNNKLKEDLDFDINSLSEIERMIMKMYQRSKEETKKLTEMEIEAENQKNRKEFENKIDEILKEKRFYKDDIIKVKINNFFDTIKRVKENKEEFLKSAEVFKIFGIFLFLGFVIVMFEVAIWVAIILAIWLLIRASRVPLNEDGELERAKIIFLINHLKKKKILSEEEKHFLIMLTSY